MTQKFQTQDAVNLADSNLADFWPKIPVGDTLHASPFYGDNPL